jgi:hypothetical protein
VQQLQDNAPVLLVAFNRPQKLRNLILSLQGDKPKIVILAIDGPRRNNPEDKVLVAECRSMAGLITWDCQIQELFQVSNIGLEKSVTYAVSWAVNKHGKVIVIEDDVEVGPDFITYMNQKLVQFSEVKAVMHISGYNVVPFDKISQKQNRSYRTSNYPESFAWATWADRWLSYDADLVWGQACTLRELRSITGSTLGAMKWKLNFRDAASLRIDTWAYRWLASIWSSKGVVISPNHNLVTYNGFDEGTHTRSKAPWTEIAVTKPEGFEDEPIQLLNLDLAAEKWLAKNVFGENLIGVFKGIAKSVALQYLTRHRRKG